MKKTIKKGIRALYLLPIIGLVFGGTTVKQKSDAGTLGILSVSKAFADVPGGPGPSDGSIPCDGCSDSGDGGSPSPDPGDC